MTAKNPALAAESETLIVPTTLKPSTLIVALSSPNELYPNVKFPKLKEGQKYEDVYDTYDKTQKIDGIKLGDQAVFVAQNSIYFVTKEEGDTWSIEGISDKQTGKDKTAFFKGKKMRISRFVNAYVLADAEDSSKHSSAISEIWTVKEKDSVVGETIGTTANRITTALN